MARIRSARVDGGPWVDGGRAEEVGVGSCTGKVFVFGRLVKVHCSVRLVVVLALLFRFRFGLGVVVVVAAIVVCVHGVGLVVAVVFLPRVSRIFLLRGDVSFKMLGGGFDDDRGSRNGGVRHWHDVVRGMFCF